MWWMGVIFAFVLFVCGVAVFVQSLPDDERETYGHGPKGQGRR